MQVNSFGTLEHALLYSIEVNLPVHRIGQLDRILVLASPINDINIHAWDLNRVHRFLVLDIGIRMELCGKCLHSNQSNNITFIMEKMFINDCTRFLCREAHIERPPISDNGFTVYIVPHQCFFNTPPSEKAPPPPYSETDVHPPTLSRGFPNHEYDIIENVMLKTSITNEIPLTPPRYGVSSSANEIPHSPEYDKPPNLTQCFTRKQLKPIFQFPDNLWEDYSSGSGSTSNLGTDAVRKSSFTESLFLSDGVLTKETTQVLLDLPPRTIPRKNHIPATTHKYYNFQPHLFNSSDTYNLETPYHISSRIIVTDDGDVQYERNILGNSSLKGFSFQKTISLPPRNLARDDATEVQMKRPDLHKKADEEMCGDADKSTSINTTLMSGIPDLSLQLNPHHTHNAENDDYVPMLTEKELPTFQTTPTASTLPRTNDSIHLEEKNPPTFQTTPINLPCRTWRRVPLPPLLNRTTSDLGLDPFSKDQSKNQTEKIYSHSSRRMSHSTSSRCEEDSYVIVSHTSRKRGPILSRLPAYNREQQSMEDIFETVPTEENTSPVKADTRYHIFDNVDDSNGSTLSLTEAGDIIRNDWAFSLEAMKLDEENQEASNLEVSPDKGEMSLDEVAFRDYKDRYETFRMSYGNIYDVSPHCSNGCSNEDYVLFHNHESSKNTSISPAVSSQYSEHISTAKSDSKQPPFIKISDSAFDETSLTCSSKKVKPAIMPRKNKSVVRQLNSSSNSTLEKQSNFDSNSQHSHTSTGLKQFLSIYTSNNSGMEYFEKPAPFQNTLQPVPRPRSGKAINFSAQASMVTMKIRHFSSSESDLQEAVDKSLTAINWSASSSKSHSSLDVSSIVG